ncbi:MAG: hypothetical protein JXR73_10005 [Candidatus Omnitrophica bacterium]|nr:hypothetical protein [Candidatus Omnitrophota bacterium]
MNWKLRSIQRTLFWLALGWMTLIGSQAFPQECLPQQAAEFFAAGGYFMNPGGEVVGQGWLGSPIGGLLPVAVDADHNGKSDVCENIIIVQNVGDPIPRPNTADETDVSGNKIPPISILSGGEKQLNEQTKVYWHPKGGADHKGELYANETGNVTIKWQAGAGAVVQTYNIEDDTGSVNFFLSEKVGEVQHDGPVVDVRSWYDPADPKIVNFRYNAFIQNATDAWVEFIGEFANFHARKTGTVVVEFNDSNGNLLNQEVIQILDPLSGSERVFKNNVVDVGQKLMPNMSDTIIPSGHGSLCKPNVTKGIDPQSKQNSYVYQQNESGATMWNVYATRPTDGQKSIVFWYKVGLYDVRWPTERDLYEAFWPAAPQVNIRASGVHPRIDVSYYYEAEIMHQPTPHAAIANREFYTNAPGICTLMYSTKSQVEGTEVFFEVVQTFDHMDKRTNKNWPVGDRVMDSIHDRSCYDSGFIYEGTNYDPEIYQFAKGVESAIFPINAIPGHDTMEIWWYVTSQNVCWPIKPVLYNCDWPAEPDDCNIIANEKGVGPFNPTKFRDPLIYELGDIGGDPAAIGFNPNEERARWVTNPGDPIYASRDDLNDVYNLSEPYIMLRYRNALEPKNVFDEYPWEYDVIRVVREIKPSDPAIPGCPCLAEPCEFIYSTTAGAILRPPAPLVYDLPYSPENRLIQPVPVDQYIWDDEKGNLWYRQGGVQITAEYFEFWRGGDSDPWLDDETGNPQDVRWNVNWPNIPSSLQNPPGSSKDVYTTMAFGQTRDRSSFRRAQILYNQADAVLIMPYKSNSVPLDFSNFPVDYETYFAKLDPHIQSRLSYDEVNGLLNFKGDSKLKLLGIMSLNELEHIQNVFNQGHHSAFRQAVGALHLATQQEGSGALDYVLEPDSPDWGIALSSGPAKRPGWVVLGYNGKLEITDPADVEVFYVGCPPYQGEVIAIAPECPFDEKITLRWSGDCGGDCKDFEFYWQIAAGDNPNDFDDVDPFADPDSPPEFSPWEDYRDPERNYAQGWTLGQNEIVIKGANVRTLTDNWVRVKVRVPLNVNPSQFACAPGTESEWTDPQLAEGWIKRVKRGLNPFDQRVKDFRKAEIATYVSMIEQLGKPYLDRVGLTCRADVVNALGLIELYQAVLYRGKGFTLDLGLNYAPAHQALMLVAGNLFDFHMLLGNEAYGDALDSTIAIGVDQNEDASSMFCFQDQLPSNQNSLIYEELALLRGRDDRGTPINRFPVYGRLPHNFTLGDGQVAYVNNYNIADKDNDGDIDAEDAAIMFPQGHGDAWGHYLTGLRFYYDLLRHPSFEWQVREEAVLVNQVPVQVSYAHERNFLSGAAAKAKTGAEIVNLVYRERYSDDPTLQWQGYQDTVPGRYWGVSEWARRSYMGAYFDWAVSNSLLRANDDDPEHQGTLKKVDRTTVPELKIIASEAEIIQEKLNEADAGLNPLGLAKNVVPFDIVPPPAPPAIGQSHFEQIYDRASVVLNNAITVFNNANRSANNLRRNQDDEQKFQNYVEEREADFNSRLIEIFGYPFPEDKNPLTGYIYGNDFVGPDLFHWSYIDYRDLIGLDLPEGDTVSVEFDYPKVNPSTGVFEVSKTSPVEFNVVPGFGLVKPRNFTLARKAPGEIQLAQSDMFLAWWKMKQALELYDVTLANIEDQADILRARLNLTQQEIIILNEHSQEIQDLNEAIVDARNQQLGHRSAAQMAKDFALAQLESIPRMFIAGVASGGDLTSIARGALLMAGTILKEELLGSEKDAEVVELENAVEKDLQNSITQLRLTTAQSQYQNHVELKKLEQMMRSLNAQRLEIFSLQESIRQSSGRYLAAIQRGMRLFDDLLLFRQQTAEQVTESRYKDMAFRIFRNDALQKYTAQFDLTSRYVLLAAKAYEYETNLLFNNSNSGEPLLSRIVRERTLGKVNQGVPEMGSGLAGIMAELYNNYQSMKSMLGFNNPTLSTNKFSLRREFFRIKPDETGEDAWRETLRRAVVRDLRTDVPEFERLVSFDPYIAPEPALVFDFGTTIQSDTNFFGWKSTSGGESFYPSDHFSIKIRSVGIWFSNYSDATEGLTTTPRVYLAPVGSDLMRIPFSGGETREWNVVDQILPLPNSLKESEFAQRMNNWLPINQLKDVLLKPKTRKYASISAMHDMGGAGSLVPNANEFTGNTFLVGRSVWNTRWVLIIPGRYLLPGDPEEGIRRFIEGAGGQGGVTDIRLAFQTYQYASAG